MNIGDLTFTHTHFQDNVIEVETDECSGCSPWVGDQGEHFGIYLGQYSGPTIEGYSLQSIDMHYFTYNEGVVFEDNSLPINPLHI